MKVPPVIPPESEAKPPPLIRKRVFRAGPYKVSMVGSGPYRGAEGALAKRFRDQLKVSANGRPVTDPDELPSRRVPKKARSASPPPTERFGSTDRFVGRQNDTGDDDE
jgi:hypothetical protein